MKRLLIAASLLACAVQSMQTQITTLEECDQALTKLATSHPIAKAFLDTAQDYQWATAREQGAPLEFLWRGKLNTQDAQAITTAKLGTFHRVHSIRDIRGLCHVEDTPSIGGEVFRPCRLLLALAAQKSGGTARETPWQAAAWVHTQHEVAVAEALID